MNRQPGAGRAEAQPAAGVSPAPAAPAAQRRLAYLDCFSGISGDMLLGALVDAGLEVETLRAGLAGLPLAGYQIEAIRETRRGLTGTRLRVRLDAGGAPLTGGPTGTAEERRLDDVLALLAASTLPEPVRTRAALVFHKLAEAEARVHGLPVAAVHFHEVGALDSIVDVVGVALGLHLLGIERLYCSALPTGGGLVETRHGPLPVPAPATLALLAEARAPLRPVPIAAELVTPTGAAVVAALATFEQPPLRIERVAHGFGTRELPWPNALRLWLGAPLEPVVGTDEVALLETNLDDAPPELLGYVLERLFAAGALDVWFAPIQMKKHRPGVLLGVVAPTARATELAHLVLVETPTLGVRVQRVGRIVAPRAEELVETPYGPVRVKVKLLGERRVAAPEYEDCARIARERGVPLAEVYRAVARAADV